MTPTTTPDTAARDEALARVERAMRWHARRYAYFGLGDFDDLLQEMRLRFLRLWDGDGTPSHLWAFTHLSCWKAADSWRRRNHRQRVARLRLLDTARPDRSHPAGRPAPDPIVRAEDAARISAVVSALPERDRDYLVRRFGLDGDPPVKVRDLDPGRPLSSTQGAVTRAALRLRFALRLCR